MKNEIIIFENQKVKLEVNMKDETVWLTQEQMSQLFGKARSTINEHIKNIYKEGELLEEETLTKFGNSEFSDKPTNYYNLDVIISVGYRVKSREGITFRRWANKVLKDYLLKGYVVNERRLQTLEKTVKLIEIANRAEDSLENNDAKDILKVIGNYSKSLDLLDDYDHRVVKKVKGTIDNRIIKYEDCLTIIKKLKFKDSSSIFGVERFHGLESIINDIYMTFNGVDVYKSVEEKAANFLYTLIKNHPFVDGNKRIAATLFIYFLNYYEILYKDNKKIIDNNTLASMILLIAESNPKEKEILIDLIMNFMSDEKSEENNKLINN